MNWSAFQREMLEALGLQPQRLATDGAQGAAASASPVDAAVPVAEPGGRERAGPVPAWLSALARVAGCTPEALLAQLPDLRAPTDAASRRALWPRLRRLRAARRRS